MGTESEASRRDFLKTGAGVGGAALAGVVARECHHWRTAGDSGVCGTDTGLDKPGPSERHGTGPFKRRLSCSDHRGRCGEQCTGDQRGRQVNHSQTGVKGGDLLRLFPFELRPAGALRGGDASSALGAHAMMFAGWGGR